MPVLSKTGTAFAVLLILAASAPADAEEPPALKNATQPEPGLVSAGQPTDEQLRGLAQAGYKTVLDLRPPTEDRGFDEPKTAREAGLAYVNIPVTPQTLDDATLDRFLEAMRTAERPVLLHCASANRTGGLYYAWLVLEKGVAPEEALKRAKEAGLRSPEIEEKVKALVEERRAKKL